MTKLEIQDDPSALMKRQQTVERKKEKAIHQLSRIPFWESESGSSGEWIVGIEEAKKVFFVFVFVFVREREERGERGEGREERERREGEERGERREKREEKVRVLGSGLLVLKSLKRF